VFTVNTSGVSMKIEFDLLANAADSIQRAIELSAWRDEQGDARRLKQAVQAIAHGVELLLKERLRRVHPALIWENVDKYPNLTARTVTADGALSRLVNVGGLIFVQEDVTFIRLLRATRNAIEHYGWTTTKQEAEYIVGQALAFALEFSATELEYEFFGYQTRKDDTFPTLLNANQAFVVALEERKSRVAKTTEVQEKTCSFCRAVAINPATGACRLCGHLEIGSQEFDDDIPF